MATLRIRVFLVLVLVLLPSILCAQSFRNPYRIPLSTDPLGIAAGDLNGDGATDFVWVEGSNGSVTLHVLLSQPTGGWLPGNSIPYPISVTRFTGCLLSDVNGDKRLDLVCTSASQFTIHIHVFLGNGDGTFQTPIATTVSTQSNGSWAAPTLYPEGDLNGDGFPDFYEIELQSQEAQILLSDGKGGFKTPIPAPSDVNAAFPVSADVNGDGIPDLLFTQGPAVALGKGNGSFGSISNYADVSYYDATCIFHDMDGDGHLDAVCGYAESISGDITGATDLIVLHGNPDGSFNTTPIAKKRFGDYNNEFDGFGTFLTPLAAADLNGDGIPDVMGASGDGLAVLLGGPSLSFSTPLHYARGYTGSDGYYSYYQSQILDVDGDGIPDIVDCGANGIYIGYGHRDGTFGSAFAPEVTEYIGYPTVADFNGDGIPDIAATGDTAIKLSLGKGDGTFAPPVALSNHNGAVNFSTPLSATNAHIVHGDFNGDGKLDLMAIGSSSIYQYDSYILFGNGDGTFGNPILVPNSSVTYPLYEQLVDNAIVDVNKDGRSDILWIQNSGSGNATAQIGFSLSNGDGTFKAVGTTVPVDPNGGSTFPALADFDGDGKLDAVYASHSNAYVVKGHGDGAFDSNPAVLPIPSLSNQSGIGSVAVATGDFDGDGNQDFVLLVQLGVGLDPLPSPLATAAWVYYGDGKGNFSAPVLAGAFNHNYSDIVATDLNQDGRADIVVKASDSPYSVYVVGVIDSELGRTFGPEVNYTAGTGISSLAVADINKDGWPDLIFGNGDYNVRASSVTELINLGNATQVSGSLYALPEPSIVTQSFALTATLTPPSPAALTGNISFLVDGAPVGSAALSGNKATLQIAGNLSIGNHALSATWPGDTTYPSLAINGSHVVIAAPTATTIASSQSPALAGSSVAFIVTVTSSYGTPSGTVSLSDGSTALGTVNLINGSGTYSISSLAVGAHSITASYAANGNFAASSASMNQVILGLSSTTALSVAPNPAYVGQGVTLTAKVSPSSGAPGSVVSFFDGAAALGSSSVNANGVASLITYFSSAGVHNLTAVCAGNQVLNGSTSAVYAETILLNPTSTSASATPNPAAAFQSISFTAQVTQSTGATPSGAVAFFANGTQIGSGSLQSGKALFSTAALGAGTFAISASYPGDTIFSSSTSSPFSLIVTAQPSQVTLASSANPAVIGSIVTLTARVAVAAGTPTGTVQFYDGLAPLGAAVSLGAQGIATHSTSTLALGIHPISAVYSGDPNTLAATSPVLQQSIVPYIGDFTLTADPASAGIYTGESAAFQINVKSVGGFNEPLALSCAGLPSAATCSFSPASIASGQGTSVLTIKTAAPRQVGLTAGVREPLNRGPIPVSNPGKLRAVLALFIAGLMLFVLPRKLRLRAWTMGLLAVCLLLGIAACGAPAPITGGTPSGSYNVTVTAAYSAPGTQLTHSAQVTLTVKSLF